MNSELIHEAGYRYLLQRAPLLQFLLSRDGTILEANAYACAFTGRALVKEKIQDVILDFSAQFDLNGFCRDPDAERMLSITAASGLPQSFHFSFEQVSEQILVLGRLDTEELETMRQEILSLNQDLNNLTRELHKKNAQLQRLNEEKNRFLGMAAHDLRKPIGLVISYAEFLLEEVEELLDMEQCGFIKTIHASSSFMKRLVDDFLDVSAIEAGRFDLDLQSASITEVLGKSLGLNRLQAEKKGVALEIQTGEHVPKINMDAAKMEQVITNLVSNAIEHSESGSRVVIRLSQESNGVMLSVQDFGPGIPPQDLDKLFKPFEKTSIKKTAGEKSTGLGMLITRKIVDAHKGTIWVDSLVGQGTTISFQLPTDIEF